MTSVMETQKDSVIRVFYAAVGTPMVTGRKVKEFGAAVIGLTMDNEGIPTDPDVRLSIAEKILERAVKIGIPAEDVVIDPLVLTIGADSMAGLVTLQTIERASDAFGVNINLGASNISFGLPERHTINQAFLSLAMLSPPVLPAQ